MPNLFVLNVLYPLPWLDTPEIKPCTDRLPGRYPACHHTWVMGRSHHLTFTQLHGFSKNVRAKQWPTTWFD